MGNNPLDFIEGLCPTSEAVHWNFAPPPLGKPGPHRVSREAQDLTWKKKLRKRKKVFTQLLTFLMGCGQQRIILRVVASTKFSYELFSPKQTKRCTRMIIQYTDKPWTDNDSSLLFAAQGKADPLISADGRTDWHTLPSILSPCFAKATQSIMIVYF